MRSIFVFYQKIYCHRFYPTAFQETGCMTLLKAMACGSIPITSRLQESVLSELTFSHDLGPSKPLFVKNLSNGLSYEKWVSEVWLAAALEGLNLPPEELQQKRINMKSDIQKKYSWKISAAKMMTQVVET